MASEKMPRFVKSLSLSVMVYKTVLIPDDVKIDKMDEGDTWWVRWDRLYYESGDKWIDLTDYNDHEWDGDYKRPGCEVEECESEDEIESECESECECSAHQKKQKEIVVPSVDALIGVPAEAEACEASCEAQAEEHQNRINEMGRGK